MWMLQILQKGLPFSQLRPYLLRGKTGFAFNILGANPLSKVTLTFKSQDKHILLRMKYFLKKIIAFKMLAFLM